MYEVEVKAKLRNKEEVKKKLESFGCVFSEELHQVDHIFLPKGSAFPPPFETPVLRVRKQNDIFLFTLKMSQGSRTDSIERELEIKDGDKMIEILNLLNWEETVMVDKKRIKAAYKDMEVVLDDVKDLGEFIEAEKIVTIHDVDVRKKIQEELFAFLETVGVGKEDHILDGKYDIMMHNKINNL